MISKRKTTTGIFAPKNRKFLIAGVAAAAIGTWLLAGDKIKAIFKGDQEPPKLPEPTTTPTPTQTIAPSPKPTTTTTPEAPGIDINKKLKKGSQGPEVKRLQFIINYVAGFRDSKSYTTPGGYTVKFPINPDSDFGNNTQAGAYFISPSFRTDGFITLDTARKRLAYIAGYYNKPFPSELVGTKNYKTYQEQYKTGQIDFGKDDRAQKIGGAVLYNPFNMV
jgi:hypothetical protein